jgi:hypothetical protein
VAIVINVNGESISYPQIGDTNWSDEATDFAIQTASAFSKIGLSSGTSVDLPGILDVTGATTLDSTLTVAGTTTLNGTANLNGNTNLGNAITDIVAVTAILNVDAGVLYVDPSTNKVGINDTTPSVELDVNGSVAITGNETIGGTLNVTGATTLSNTLGVTGNVAVNTNKFNVTASSGNTLIAGTLGVTGIETITNTTDATSSTDGALIVSGGVGIAKKLYVGTDLSVGGNFSVTGGINPPYLNMIDEKPSGTVAGTFTSGAWRTRDLNTIKGTNSITGSSLSSNQFTLPAGTYRILASAPTYAVNSHKAKLRNITDSSDTLIGTSEVSNQTYNGATRSFVSGIFTIAAQKTFEIQHYCSSSQNFGQASSFSVVEIYTVVELWKLA